MGEENTKKYLSAVEKYVTATLGALPVVPLKEGVNANYTVGNPPRYVIKVGIYCDLDRETASLNILRKHGIPSPEIIAHEPKNEDIEYGLLVMQYTPHDGQQAHDQLQLGKLLSQIHTITGIKYGPISPTGEGTYSTWKDYLLSLPKKRESLLRDTLGENLETLLTLPPLPNKHSFLHLDFAGDNVLTHNGKIVAVIDPHGAFGDPLLDIAYCSVMNTEPKNMRLFMQGYASNGLSLEELERLRHYRTIAALDKYGIVLEKFAGTPKPSTWWHTRKKRMETIIHARLDRKDDAEFVESFL